MKKFLTFTLLIFPYLGISQYVGTIVADTFSTVQHRHIDYDYDESTYFGALNPYTATNYQGTAYCFFLEKEFEKTCGSCWTDAVYVFDSVGYLHPLSMKSNYDTSLNIIDYFGYPGEDKPYLPVYYTRPFTFEYNSQLWYCKNVESNNKDSLIEAFARLPLVNQAGRCHTYYERTPLMPDGLNFVKLAGFQSDTLAWFICGSIDNSQHQSPYPVWIMQKYAYNSHMGKFVWISNEELSGFVGHGKTMGQIIIKRDVIAKTDKIFFTTNDDNSIWFWQITMSSGVYTVKQLDKITKPNNLAVGDATIAPGAIQGARNPLIINNLDKSDRLTMFIVAKDKIGSHFPVLFKEYYFDDDQLYPGNYGAVLIPSGQYPDKLQNDISIFATFTLRPAHLSNTISNDPSYIDGFRQRTWLFYPVYDVSEAYDIIRAIGFNSDIWRPAKDSIIVSSNDLYADSLYGDEIRDLWMLMGIVDGGPPCSVKWQKWDSLHPLNSPYPDPTTLDLSFTSEHNIELTNTFEDKFTQGLSMYCGGGEATSFFGGGFEESYSYAFKKVNSSGTETKYTWKTDFSLTEPLQEHGNFIWAIPEIKRFAFMRYPWWDDAKFGSPYHIVPFSHPIDNSLQYLFRTYGIQIQNEAVPISDFPFRIHEPNEETLSAWYLQNRDGIYSTTSVNNISSIGSATWFPPSSPGNLSFEQVNSTSVTTETSNSFEIKVQGGIKIPEIFKLTLSLGYDVKYSSEVKTTSKIGNEASLDINPLMSYSQIALNVDQLVIDLWWFSSQDGVDYWYWDSIPVTGQKPWYIAYTATTSSGRLISIYPEEAAVLRTSDLVFNWKSENSGKEKYTLFITSSWPVTPASIVYQQEAGENFAVSSRGFVPEIGKTYYWSVRGVCSDGGIRWSEPRSFYVQSDEIPNSEMTSLQALVYPNPANSGNINILLKTAKSENITITLMEASGKILYRRSEEVSAESFRNIAFPPLSLEPGMYLVEVRTSNERTVKKLILLR